MTRIALLAVCLWILLMSFGTGCAARPRQAATPPPPPPPKPVEPWMTTRSFCVLPLTKSEIPPTGGELGTSVVSAWKGLNMRFKDGADVVTVHGGRYPHVQDLHVNLTDSEVVPGKPRASIGAPKPTAHALSVDRFSLVAAPARTRGAEMSMQLTGVGVRMELQQDKAGNPLLMMTDAQAGSLHFDISKPDLEKVMLSILRDDAKKRAIHVRSVAIDLHSHDGRSIDATMTVRMLVGFVPAGLTFTVGIDVDEQMNGTMTRFDVDGDEILGPLITTFIRPGLAKHLGKTRPILGFPGQSIKLQDVRITGGDRIRLDAVFGK